MTTPPNLGQTVATPGAVVNVPAVAGGQYTILFPSDATGLNLVPQVNLATNHGVASFIVNKSAMVVTMDGTVGNSVIGWIDGAGTQQGMTLQAQQPAASLCGPGTLPNPAWLVAQAMGTTTTGIAPCIPTKTVPAATSSASKVAIVAAGAAVAAVGIAVAASRGVFTAVAHEAAENIRRSRV